MATVEKIAINAAMVRLPAHAEEGCRDLNTSSRVGCRRPGDHPDAGVSFPARAISMSTSPNALMMLVSWVQWWNGWASTMAGRPWDRASSRRSTPLWVVRCVYS